MASDDRLAPEVRAGAGPAASVRQRIDSSWALMPIVAASGFAGLGYEIVWTRQLSLALGSEMMAVLGAVAGFFAGLALGAFVFDRPIRQARSPRMANGVRLTGGCHRAMGLDLRLAAAHRWPGLVAPSRHRARAGPAVGGQLCTTDVGAVTRNRGNGRNVDRA
jgi:hypothetical protein